MIWLDMKDIQVSVMINPKLIKDIQYIEEGSIVTLKNGNTYKVKQSKKQVQKLIKENK